MVAWIAEDDSVPEEASGLRIFIDVWQVKEVIEGKSHLAGIDQPTLDQKIELLIQYAVNDA